MFLVVPFSDSVQTKHRQVGGGGERGIGTAQEGKERAAHVQAGKDWTESQPIYNRGGPASRLVPSATARTRYDTRDVTLLLWRDKFEEVDDLAVRGMRRRDE